MGFIAANPSKLWFEMVYDAGTHYLGVRNCRGTGGIIPFRGDGIDTTTTIGAGADSAGVTYTSTGVTGKPTCLIGFVEYGAGLAVPGTWGTTPSQISLFVPGMARPGDVVQEEVVTSASSFSTTSSTYQTTNLTTSWFMRSVFNCLICDAHGALYINSAAQNSYARMHVDSTAFGSEAFLSGLNGYITASCVGFIQPATTSSITVAVKLKNSDNAATAIFSGGITTGIHIKEIAA